MLLQAGELEEDKSFFMWIALVIFTTYVVQTEAIFIIIIKISFLKLDATYHMHKMLNNLQEKGFADSVVL